MTLIFEEKIESALREVRNRLSMHGGGIRLAHADASTGEVRVCFEGACAGCPFAAATLEGIVESALAEVPGVTRVVAIEDSAEDPDGAPLSV
jgi:Fe-S cluster biogenesis protein NfuA